MRHELGIKERGGGVTIVHIFMHIFICSITTKNRIDGLHLILLVMYLATYCKVSNLHCINFCHNLTLSEIVSGIEAPTVEACDKA